MRAAGGFKLKAAMSLGLLFATAVTFLACSRAPAAIEHTVIILQENHTFDNYFGTFPGADGATSGLTSTGPVVPLSPMPDAYQASLCNSWDCAIQAMDAGKMDGFDLISGGLAPYTQATEQEIPNYWEYARHFVLADRYFTSVHGPSLPNHLFTVAAQSGGAIDNEFGTSGGTACDGSPSGTVAVIDPNGNRRRQSPCFDFMTLPDLLERAGISWKYYIDGDGIFATIRHIRNSSMWTNNRGHVGAISSGCSEWAVTGGELASRTVGGQRTPPEQCVCRRQSDSGVRECHHAGSCLDFHGRVCDLR